jgi:truncated hemoglobin YjbI
MTADDRIERAGRLYERFVYAGDASALAAADQELDAVEADLALARGQIIHALFLQGRDEETAPAEDPRELALFERARHLYQTAGDVRGEAESLFWIGCCQQVVRHDNAVAVPVLERSYELAAQVSDKRTMSEALRHLGIAEHAAGRLDAARGRLEESARLRREIGLMPGVAANMVGLIYIAAAQDRRSDALALAAEASAIAEASGAAAILRQVDEARAQVSSGTMQSVYEAAGGTDGLLRLAEAWHSRVMADEVVSHAFLHGFHPQHSERLAAYWAEALGGPSTYSDNYGDETSVVRLHSGEGEHTEMDERAIACFDQAMQDVGLDAAGQLRQVLHDYFAWATTTTMARYEESADDVPEGLSIPRWSWDGLQR